MTVSRRDLLHLGLAGLACANAEPVDAAAPPPSIPPLLTPAKGFRDVSRVNPHPSKMTRAKLIEARLTPDTWRLEIVSDGTASVAKPRTIADKTALTLAELHKLGKKRGVKFLKAMQCLNIAQPLGQGLWEGVPLRDVIITLGKLGNFRRLYYWGFHNDNVKKMFRSSLSYTQVMETPPGELPPFLAYKLNGEALPLERGGPVRMVIPWAHGFKSIKWLEKIVLTNDHQANDTYADQNNDPESYLKTAAYLDDVAETFKAGKPITISGTVISGLSGLKKVESWLRPDTGGRSNLPEDDPAWLKAKWVACKLEPVPKDWTKLLPAGVSPKDLWGFDATGKPADWPLRYSMISWSATISKLPKGKYEFRARAVDRNGFAQPEPRPYQKSGRNPIQLARFEVR